MPELGLGCLDGFVAEKEKGMMACIGGVAEPTVWYGLPLWMLIVVKTDWRLAPSSFSILGIWGNLLYGDRSHCHDTCSIEA
jgi:hypothetical protein